MFKKYILMWKHLQETLICHFYDFKDNLKKITIVPKGEKTFIYVDTLKSFSLRSVVQQRCTHTIYIKHCNGGRSQVIKKRKRREQFGLGKKKPSAIICR